MSLPTDITELIGDRVNGLEIYAPEPLEDAAARLGLPLGQMIKLDANENPHGPTQRTRAALHSFGDWQFYPDALSRRLRESAARYAGVSPERVLVGNGSDELIDLVLRVFRPDRRGGGIGEVIDCPPTFSQYAFYAASNDLTIRRVARRDFRLDLPAIEALCVEAAQPRIAFVASPNNPDGAVLSVAELERLLALPLLVVLDEAYVEFSNASLLAHALEHDNLIVLRTFSKWAGLAGLRVGYGVFPEALMPALLRLKSPYNVNAAAQAAALATLEDLDEAQTVVRRIIAERERLLGRLAEIPFLEVRPSRANFVLVKTRDVPLATIRAAMERRGIMLRYYEGDPALADCMRISVGTAMQNESLLLVLRDIAQQEG